MDEGGLMRTLAVMNENARSWNRTWGNYVLQIEYAVGRYGRYGTHSHLVRIERVLGEIGEHRPGTFTVGQVFSTMPICNSQRGQHGAKLFVDGYLDTQDITCAKCRANL